MKPIERILLHFEFCLFYSLNIPMSTNSSEEKLNHFTFAFYNLENLFDPKNDPKKLDDDFTEFFRKKMGQEAFR